MSAADFFFTGRVKHEWCTAHNLGWLSTQVFFDPLLSVPCFFLLQENVFEKKRPGRVQEIAIYYMNYFIWLCENLILIVLF